MKKFNLGQSVAIAANICVIIGILFLGIEIRGNTVATQATNIQIASEMDQSFLIELGSDSELSRIWTTFLRDPSILTDAERTQAAYLFAALVRRLENILLQYDLGALSEDGWKSRQALFTGIASAPGYTVFRKSLPAGLSGKAILDYLDQLQATQP